MSDEVYRVTIEDNGASLCPWHYEVQDPSGNVIESSYVYTQEYAESCARWAIERDKHRRATLYSFEVSA